MKLELNFTVLIQPYSSGLKIAFEEEAELDSQNQNIIGHEKLTKPTVPNVLYYYHATNKFLKVDCLLVACLSGKMKKSNWVLFIGQGRQN